MQLVICEKPSVAQSIAAVLNAKQRQDGFLMGNGWIVSWCFGHLVELASAGDGDGSLIDHICAYAEYNRHDESYQQYLAGKGGNEQELINYQLDEIINDLVPYFRTHCILYEMEAASLSELMDIHEKAAGQPSEADKPRIVYLESVVEYANQARTVLNSTGLDALPEPPHPAAEAAGRKTVRNEKPSVLDKIKAAQKAPKQPPKPKQERGKKQHDSEL